VALAVESALAVHVHDVDFNDLARWTSSNTKVEPRPNGINQHDNSEMLEVSVMMMMMMMMRMLMIRDLLINISRTF